MKAVLLTAMIGVAWTTQVHAQFLKAPPGASGTAPAPYKPNTEASAPPSYGYLVYDKDGNVVKAFGPETPVQSENGAIAILGSDLPAGSYVRTEDGITYMKALGELASRDVPNKSDYDEAMQELVAAISDGATYIRKTLCDHPARPSTVKVEIEGGFSFGVHAGMTSTVDWNLDQVCASPPSSAEIGSTIKPSPQ